MKLKNLDFKNKTEKKVELLGEEYKTLIQACQLPDNVFVEVMKFVII